ncbi:dihydropyrimidinase [Komagataeibacter xylinus]|uniref:D-hydantoinase n=1 Tax=Komagataeibacter xylinus TaxID=28448 RepID=A0A318Q1Q3_KOMXY|nr:dihydropyrimidinase [Komagataeibacter xylinus]PYD56725.1 dihydropyrimidinase [Komagataeibacter xylinus]GBQ74036.1 dihydroorotase [Komagataeibacter xylinus NBRC 15237]
MTYDIVIRGGTIVTATDTVVGDVGINGRHVAAIGQKLEGRQVIDAAGLLVMPGGVDGHCHIEQDEADGTVHEDTFDTASASALAGGTTSVVCFSNQLPGRPLVEQFEYYQAKGRRSRIDYAIHQIVTRADEETLETGIPRVVELGAAGLKIFMTYDDFHLGDGDILKVLSAAKRANTLVSVHCENYEAIAFLIRQYLERGETAPYFHALSRPPVVEREATYRATCLAELIQQKLQVFHVSCPEVAHEIARGKARGVPVMAETCPQYFVLKSEDMNREGFEGARYMCSPPPRTPADSLGLWECVRQGVIDVISSDHCGYSYDGPRGKSRHGRDAPFSVVPNGIPGLATRLPLIYDEGVNKGQITLNQFVALVATNPARRYGLYPRKGSIAPGFDADIVLWDPRRSVTITNSMLHHAIDYTPYEGRSVTGWPVMTLSKGKVLMQDNVIMDGAPEGEFLNPRAL